MESQEFFWPCSTKRIQKYPSRTSEHHIEYSVSSTASGYKYSSKDIVKKIDFVLTDSILHNLNKTIERVRKIFYENCFFCHWFYLWAINSINAIYHWYFITMFLNLFNGPLKCYTFFIYYYYYYFVFIFLMHLHSFQICDDIEVDTVPSTILCNVHLLMMIDRKLKDLCQQIHNFLRKQKISGSSLVEIECQMNYLYQNHPMSLKCYQTSALSKTIGSL